jgi:enamine deaminase RidA (YjgF/YER057c/UK114 family)
VTTYVTKRDDVAPPTRNTRSTFPTNKPARTTVTAALNSPELLIEITVTAGIPS